MIWIAVIYLLIGVTAAIITYRDSIIGKGTSLKEDWLFIVLLVILSPIVLAISLLLGVTGA